MDRKKQLVFKYFDTVFLGYKKHGRRPANVSPPHVLYEYMNDDGYIAFEYNTENQSIRFDIDDFNTTKNMFKVYTDDLTRICKEYVANKFGEPEALTTTLFLRKLN